MSRIGSTARALPMLFRIGFAEAVAYRAEFLVWILATTMPLIMLALWSAVARDGPVGRFGQTEFTAYFLATFLVRQLTGSWAAWQMNFEIRQGTLATRLLRPIHPMVSYAVENLAAQPLRLVAAVPAAIIGLIVVGAHVLPQSATLWLAWLAAMLGAWLITFLSSYAIGCLAFFAQSSLKVMDVWLTLFFVLSGYLIPVELFPPGLHAAIDWLPFRYQIGLPVEILTSAHATREVFGLLVVQWGWVAFFFVVALALWKAGLKRFAAFGG
jgi:ABC-2 type transport system permease protein